MFFDYAIAARHAGVSPEQLDRLVMLAREEFPGDDLMAELHVVRMLLAVERGWVTLEGILPQEG